MVVISIVVFALVRLSGDPIQIMAPPEASQADIAAMRAYLGLDRPWAVQYGRVITRALRPARLWGPRVRRARPGGAAVLAGTPARAGLRSDPALAADVGPRHAAPHHPARDHAGLVRRGRAHATRPVGHARRPRHRVRQARPHQGLARASGDLEARVQE